MRKITKLWKQKDGNKIRICDMTDSHLLNTIKLLIKNGKNKYSEAICHYPCFQGEMAQYYAENEWDALNEIHPTDFCFQEYPILEFLILEADRRKLDTEFIYE